jgi:hypothetical protein
MVSKNAELDADFESAVKAAKISFEKVMNGLELCIKF